MKLIILRHAKRYSSPGFDIPLTSGTTQVSLTASDSLAPYRFISQAKWVRTAYDPDPSNSGTFTKVLMRN